MKRSIIPGGIRGAAFAIGALGMAVTTLSVIPSQAGASPAANAGTTTHSYNVTCNVGIFGNQTLPVTFKDTAPASEAPGASFSITAVRLTITIPKSLAEAAYAAGGRSFAGKLTTDNVTSSDATPSALNFAKKPIPIPKTTIPPASAVVLYIPGKNKSFSIGPFTAGTAGTDTSTLGTSDTTVTMYNGSGGVVTTINATCQAPSPVTHPWSVTVS